MNAHLTLLTPMFRLPRLPRLPCSARLLRLARWRGAATLLLVGLSVQVAPPAMAHAGEDHGAAAAMPAAALLPRASATTEAFELVAVLEAAAGRLLVYVDDADRNAPVSRAEVQVDGAGPTGAAAMAAEIAPGVYALALAQPLAAGAHALSFTVQAGNTADLLAATLNMPAPSAAAPNAQETGALAAALSSAGRPAAAWLAAGLLLAAGAWGVIWMRRRRTSAKP